MSGDEIFVYEMSLDEMSDDTSVNGMTICEISVDKIFVDLMKCP